ncbi:zinc metalloprotease [Chitinophaga silvatica]|nr:hypothetical protein [Chitinophaga silvatica]
MVVKFLTVFFHELGHALPALKYSRMPVIIYIGSWGDPNGCIYLSSRNLDIYIKRNPLAWFRGLCMFDPEYLTLKQHIILVLAGPIFSFLVAGVATTIAILFDMHGSLKLISGLFLLSAIIDLFHNLYPRTIILSDYRIIRTDGRILIDLLHDYFSEKAMMKSNKKRKNNIRRM